MVRTRTAKRSYPQAMISRINAPTMINQGNAAQNLLEKAWRGSENYNLPDEMKTKYWGLDTSKATLHVASAREILIEQSGFSRREKLHFLKSDTFSHWGWY